MKNLVIIFASILLLNFPAISGAQDKAETIMPSWNMKGDLVITDTCEINCPCLFGLDPHHGHCRFLGGMMINEGSYGDISLDGVTWGMLGEFTGSGEDQKFLYTGYYIDDNASEDQQMAVRSILSAAPFSELGEQLGIKITDVGVVVPEKSVGEYKLTLGEMGDISVMPVVGNDKNNPQKVLNPVYPFPTNEVILGSATGKFSDHGKDMDLQNNSGEISQIELSGGGM